MPAGSTRRSFFDPIDIVREGERQREEKGRKRSIEREGRGEERKNIETSTWGGPRCSAARGPEGKGGGRRSGKEGEGERGRRGERGEGLVPYPLVVRTGCIEEA